MKTLNHFCQPLPNLCRHLFAVLCFAILMPLLCIGSQEVLAADDYPNRPIELIVPFPAGGPADTVGRIYGQHLSNLLGQSIVTQNLSGGGGVIGTEKAVQANPDGYTILFGTTSTMAVNEIVMTKLSYKFNKDFALIGLVARAPHVLAVRADLPAKTASELIALAKKNPGKYTFSTAGKGTIVGMAGELFKWGAGIDILHVPYKGGAPATLAVLTGEVDMTVNDLTTLRKHFKSGKIRPLAVAHSSRLKVLPDVPTFTELGMPQIVSSTWWGISVPVRTPEEIQGKLKAANSKIVVDPGYAARFAEMAVEPLILTPEETATFIASEVQKWKKVAEVAKVRID